MISDPSSVTHSPESSQYHTMLAQILRNQEIIQQGIEQINLNQQAFGGRLANVQNRLEYLSERMDWQDDC